MVEEPLRYNAGADSRSPMLTVFMFTCVVCVQPRGPLRRYYTPYEVGNVLNYTFLINSDHEAERVHMAASEGRPQHVPNGTFTAGGYAQHT